MAISILIAYPCAKLDSSYIIPESVTLIMSYAFSGCENLNSVTINNQIKQIRQYSFYNCNKLRCIIYNGLDNPDFTSPIVEKCNSFQAAKVTDEFTSSTFCNLKITKEELPDFPTDGDIITNPSDTNPTDTNPSDTNPTDANPSDTNPTDANPSDTNPPNDDGNNQSNNIDETSNINDKSDLSEVSIPEVNPSQNENSSHDGENMPGDNQGDNKKKSKTGIIVGCVVAVIAVIAIVAITVTFYLKKIACFKKSSGNSTSEGNDQIEEI